MNQPTFGKLFFADVVCGTRCRSDERSQSSSKRRCGDVDVSLGSSSHDVSVGVDSYVATDADVIERSIDRCDADRDVVDAMP